MLPFPFRVSLLLCLILSPALAQDAAKPLALPAVSPDLITLHPQIEADRFILRVMGPEGVRLETEFSGLATPFIEPFDSEGYPLPNGEYRFELIAAPNVDPAVRQAILAARKAGDTVAEASLKADYGLDRIPVQTGSFLLENGAFLPALAATDEEGDGGEPTEAVYNEELIVTDGLCVGDDCTMGQTFGNDTIRLKSETLRIHIDDTTSGTTDNDWRLLFNDAASSGAEYFAIEDTSDSTVPFLIEDGAGNNALYVHNGGAVGFGTNSPAERLHISHGDAPSIRLQQDTSLGLTQQIWNISGDEESLAITDFSGSVIPFVIDVDAPTDSFHLDSDGDLGLGVAAPTKALDIKRTNGTAQIRVEEASPVKNARIMVDLINKGPSRIRYQNTFTMINWNASNDSSGYIIDGNNSTGEDLMITNSGRFLIRPNGVSDPGLVLENNGDMEIGGTLTENSNRHAKKDFEPVDPHATLEKVSSLPLSEWTYKDDEQGARHFGPMAQDFADAFGLGKDREHIAVMDMAGVALASIQGLKAQLDDKAAELARKDAKIQALESENQRIQGALAEQQARLAALERLVRELADK